MKIIVLHDAYNNEPIIIKADAISHIARRINSAEIDFEEYSTVYASNFCFDVNEHLDDILKKLEIAESEVNKKIGTIALRVYDETLDADPCGNCLRYVNKDFNYCPQCGAKLEDFNYCPQCGAKLEN